jgi:predicted nucleic acid-binding Zn ribbon protein
MAKNQKPRRTFGQTAFTIFAILIIIMMLLSTVSSLFI